MQPATLRETRRIAHREEQRIARWGGWKTQVFTSGGSWAFYNARELPKGTLCLALYSLVQVLLKGRQPATSMVTGGESSVGCTKQKHIGTATHCSIQTAQQPKPWGSPRSCISPCLHTPQHKWRRQASAQEELQQQWLQQRLFKPPLILVICSGSCIRVGEWFRWKETSAGHLVQLPAQSRASEIRLPRALSSFIRLKCKQCHSCSVASLITEMHYLDACSKNRIVAPRSYGGILLGSRSPR